MSVAQKLPVIDKDFMQLCPLCGQDNRMIVKGVKHYDKYREIYPDIGYSFCNCKNIFYTDYENVWLNNKDAFSDKKDHLAELKNIWDALKPGYRMAIVMPDPFFVEWGKDPYEFLHWNPRLHHIIWDMYEFCEEARKIGFTIESAQREFRTDAKQRQTFRVALLKDVDKNDPQWKTLYEPETILRAASQAAKLHFGDKPILMAEIGVLKGDYSALMLEEMNIEKIYLVDTWVKVWDLFDSEEHEENHQKVMNRFHGNQKVNIVVDDSVRAAFQFQNRSLDYVYIDADHLYDAVKDDINAWIPKVKQGGIIGGHDYDYSIRPSVKEAVHEIFGDKVQSGENQNTLWDWWVFV